MTTIRKRKSGGKPRNRSKRTTAEGNPVFQNVEEAIQEGRLFHSVVQNPYRIDHADLDDSDTEVGEEQEWRLRLRSEEMVEFTDTIAVEQLFMNLWNQFVGMEFRLDSDRAVAGACRVFLEKYYKTMKRLSLEVSFLRHMSEMHRIGLVDSDDVFNCILRIRELEEANDDKPEPRFLYAEETLRREERVRAKEKNEKIERIERIERIKKIEIEKNVKNEKNEKNAKNEKNGAVSSPTQTAT